MALPIVGGSLKGMKWVIKSSDFSCFMGRYEVHVQDAIRAHVRSGETAYDIGANVGFHTLLCAKVVGAGGRVMAFEPFPRNVGILKRHLRMNAIDNVTVVEAAISESNGQVWFSAPADLHGSMGHIAEHESSGTICVNTLALDGSGFPAPSFIKMDVEGHELLALQGMRNILLTSRPVLVIERSPASFGEVEKFLAQAGYQSNLLLGDASSRSGDWLSLPLGK